MSPRREPETDTAPLPVVKLPAETLTASRDWEDPQVYVPDETDPATRPARRSPRPQRPARRQAPARPRRNEPEPEPHSRGGMFTPPPVNLFSIIGQTVTGAAAAVLPFILTAVFISTWLWVSRGFTTDQAQIDAVEHILGHAADNQGTPWGLQGVMPPGIHNTIGGFILAPYVILFIGALGFLTRGKFVSTVAYLLALALFTIPYNAFVAADPLHIGFFRVMVTLNPFTLYGYVFP